MRKNSRDLGWLSSITKSADSSSGFFASDPDPCGMKGRLSSGIFGVRWNDLYVPGSRMLSSVTVKEFLGFCRELASEHVEAIIFLVQVHLIMI